MTARVVIAGGGLAGLSLAVALLDRDPSARVSVLEPRTAYADDRTWCFWDVEPHPFRELIAQRWRSWRVATAAGEAVAEDGRVPYARVRGGDVYARARERIAAAPNAELRLGVTVRRVAGDHVETETGEMIGAEVVCDGRPPDADALRAPGEPFLWQVFAGARVQARPGTFAPGTVDLMDFRVPQVGEIRFRYVLPADDASAFVELTAFTPALPEPGALEGALGDAIAAIAGGGATIGAREQGAIPMTTAPAPAPAAPGVIPIGTRAGAPRPSTGYAFLPIQRHAARLAERILADAAAPLATSAMRRRRISLRASSRSISFVFGHDSEPGSFARLRRALACRPGRSDLIMPMRGPGIRCLDRIFLNRLLAEPQAAPELFRRLAAGVPGDALARFLMERARPADVVRVMAALPVGAFAREAVRSTAPWPARAVG